MKKKIITFLIIVILLAIGILTYLKLTKEENSNNLTKVKLAEVTHSVFYAPLYVAIENDYFKDAGIDLEVILTPGADKVSAAVLSNSVDIGFAGTESAIYVYEGGETDYLVTFAGLTKRDGQFIIGRDCNKEFKLEDLYGKEILVGRPGGMPALNFLNAMKNNNVDLNKININYAIDFASLSGSFIGGIGDYVDLFEPTATSVVKLGNACIVESIGSLSGEVPYTAFYARKSFLNNNPELIEKFTEAINKGLEFVKNNDSKTIANIILPSFPDSSLNDIETIINNYKKYDSWLENPYITEESFKNLENILLDNKLIKDYVPYNKLINNFYEK
ncbi:MAG: ABC transporter substrate-binding protein [Bacilli bacterium]|nr:ABC transporter substrate-binding protein [Bacilli bacterium]MCX4253828.1 ABC transporter substrate-binding protein [Bacilli bacterium]